MTRTFPPGFLWGVTTGAHQTEGNNLASDWWASENAPGATVKEPSGDADDSYHRWREDMDLVAGAGFTDYRFGVEWSRVEPADGRISHAVVAHYRRMVEGAVERVLRPLPTLHHFTHPLWFTLSGGWSRPDAVERFLRYVDALAPVLEAGVERVGVQAYTRGRITVAGGEPVPVFDPAAPVTQTGWEDYPAALGGAVRRAAQMVGHVPLIVTENGIATADDARRIAFTDEALDSLRAAMDDGVDVRGYLHWSLLDNYEWGSYRPTFGLVAVDRVSFRRTPKPSLAAGLRPGRADRDRAAGSRPHPGTGDHLGHEYQFNFGLPQARTAFRQTLAFLASTTRG